MVKCQQLIDIVNDKSGQINKNCYLKSIMSIVNFLIVINYFKSCSISYGVKLNKIYFIPLNIDVMKTNEYTDFHYILNLLPAYFLIVFCSSPGVRFDKPSQLAHGFLYFRGEAWARPFFHVYWLPFPPCSPKSPSILMQPCGDSTGH